MTGQHQFDPWQASSYGASAQYMYSFHPNGGQPPNAYFPALPRYQQQATARQPAPPQYFRHMMTPILPPHHSVTMVPPPLYQPPHAAQPPVFHNQPNFFRRQPAPAAGAARPPPLPVPPHQATHTTVFYGQVHRGPRRQPNFVSAPAKYYPGGPIPPPPPKPEPSVVATESQAESVLKGASGSKPTAPAPAPASVPASAPVGDDKGKTETQPASQLLAATRADPAKKEATGTAPTVKPSANPSRDGPLSLSEDKKQEPLMVKRQSPKLSGQPPPNQLSAPLMDNQAGLENSSASGVQGDSCIQPEALSKSPCEATKRPIEDVAESKANERKKPKETHQPPALRPQGSPSPRGLATVVPTLAAGNPTHTTARTGEEAPPKPHLSPPLVQPAVASRLVGAKSPAKNRSHLAVPSAEAKDTSTSASLHPELAPVVAPEPSKGSIPATIGAALPPTARREQLVPSGGKRSSRGPTAEDKTPSTPAAQHPAAVTRSAEKTSSTRQPVQRTALQETACAKESKQSAKDVEDNAIEKGKELAKEGGNTAKMEDGRAKDEKEKVTTDQPTTRRKKAPQMMKEQPEQPLEKPTDGLRSLRASTVSQRRVRRLKSEPEALLVHAKGKRKEMNRPTQIPSPTAPTTLLMTSPLLSTPTSGSRTRGSDAEDEESPSSMSICTVTGGHNWSPSYLNWGTGRAATTSSVRLPLRDSFRKCRERISKDATKSEATRTNERKKAAKGNKKAATGSRKKNERTAKKATDEDEERFSVGGGGGSKRRSSGRHNSDATHRC